MRKCDVCLKSYRPAALGQVCCSFKCSRRLYEVKQAEEDAREEAEKIAKHERWRRMPS